MDRISYILNQPGYSKEEILDLNCTDKPYGPYDDDGWDLPGADIPKTPVGYKICIKPSSDMPESDLVELISNKEGAKPGIYILYAIPVNGVSGESLPVRRIFCRPQPFC